MNTLPQISDAEFEVMNVIWKYAPINTNDIVEKVSQNNEWSPKTIQTMISRLEKKGLISHEKEGRIFVYSPRVLKESYLEAESRTFANRFFDGAMNRVVVNYLDNSELTEDDIHELQAILERKRKK